MNADTGWPEDLTFASRTGRLERGNASESTRLPSPKVSSASSVKSSRNRNGLGSLRRATRTPCSHTANVLVAIEYRHSGEFRRHRDGVAAFGQRAQRGVDADGLATFEP